MKNVVSKLTFGFFMAQLFPGAIALYSLAFAYFALDHPRQPSLLVAANNVPDVWDRSGAAHRLFLVGLSIGIGMAIHGIHWAVVGFLEQRYGSALRSPWQMQRLWKQVLQAPPRMLHEVIRLFREAKAVKVAAVKDNVTDVPSETLGQFEYLQDFYLYPAQFLVHTGYALILVVAADVAFIVGHGPTWRRLVVAILAYLLSGTFFVIGRVHLQSLFRAEFELVQREGERAQAPKDRWAVDFTLNVSRSDLGSPGEPRR